MSKIQNPKLPMYLKLPFGCTNNNNQSAFLGAKQSSKLHQVGFTVLEVLVSLSILVLTLMVLYQSFSSSIFVLSSTTNLWNAMSHAQNELLKSERATVSTPVSVNQGEFDIDDPMSGFRWKKQVRDTTPLPGIMVRQINYELLWSEGKQEYTYDADIYVNPQ